MNKYLIITIIVLLAIIGAGWQQLEQVTDKWKVAEANVKAYSEELSTSGKKNTALQLSIDQLKYFNDSNSVDVIIIGRGGGSIEDLWAFNDESVARAVSSSRIPVISAVGHETDFTICDFAADVRAATPSQAAEFAVPDTEKLRVQLQNVVNLEARFIISKIASLREKFSSLSSRRSITDPGSFIDERRIVLDMRTEKLSYSFDKVLSDKKSTLSSVCAKLETLSPLSVISRGYSAVTDGDGRLVKSVGQLSVGDAVTLRLGGGEADAGITSIRKDGTI